MFFVIYTAASSV